MVLGYPTMSWCPLIHSRFAIRRTDSSSNSKTPRFMPPLKMSLGEGARLKEEAIAGRLVGYTHI